ncbi:UDP-2,4-diacetamido-2,4,6-trideoxy-beta-L-altropyranose hydrolase [Lysinibacillus sp. B2A1]|nr:UDP-2,4-diacetamido-2,4,6-trideoxy-beta-L-altropyranose hydrolase [Lysinibacillus sp. B2A1]
MNVIIRTDASLTIGSGHVMRCLTVAKKLQKIGFRVRFWMEPLPGNLIDFVEQQGFTNIMQADYADLYIVDHYSLDRDWEKKVQQFTQKLVVIDDLARTHDCDLLLDQNLVPNYRSRYDGLVPEHCIKLLGPTYLIMRDEYNMARRQLSKRSSQVERLLVFMGGSDPTNETMKVLAALESCLFRQVDVVVGSNNPLKIEIEAICRKRSYNFHCQIDYMAKLMLQADFAIGAGGSAMWERFYVGLPSSTTIVAENQKATTNYAAVLGAVINLGWHEQVTSSTYKSLLSEFTIEGMSNKGLELTMNKQSDAWMHEILELMKC